MALMIRLTEIRKGASLMGSVSRIAIRPSIFSGPLAGAGLAAKQ